MEEDDGRDTAYYRDPNGAITIADSDDNTEQPEDAWQKNYRPWLAEGFTKEDRKVWEMMYVASANRPMGKEQDWMTTEGYVRHQDMEIMRYEVLLFPFYFSL